jgi:sec-independent protein translocase protein TatC
MFYFQEFFFRLFYSLFCFLLVFFICFFYKNVILQFLVSNATFSVSTCKHLIYTYPSELFNIQIRMSFWIGFLVSFFFIFFSTLDYIRSGLFINEYKSLNHLFFNSFVFYLLFIYLSIWYVFPQIWSFFIVFNNSVVNFQKVNFFFELKLEDFFFFFFNFIFVVNCISVIFIFFFNLIFFYGIVKLLSWKKLLIFLNIMFSTFLSPPDVFIQFSIYIYISIFFEFIIFFNIFFKKAKKIIIFKKATY